MTLDELRVDIGFRFTQLRAVVVGGGAALREVLERAVAVTQQRFRENRPALNLAEDTAVFLRRGVKQQHVRAVESVLLVAGRHDFHTEWRVQLLERGLHGLFRLFRRCQTGNDRPRLRVEPHGRFGIVLAADDAALLAVPAAETVILPEVLVDERLLFLRLLAQVDAVFVVLRLVGHQFIQQAQGEIQLHGDEGGFARRAQTQAVVPVRVQTRRHTMRAQMIHGEVNRALQVIKHRAFAVRRIRNDLVHKRGIARFGDILVNSREQPQRIVRAIMRMTRGADVAVVLRGILVPRVVVELHQRQTAAVMHLRAEHENKAFLRHLRVKVDDALNVLHRVAVAQTVALTAVDEGRRAAPDKRREALEGVPSVDHAVEIRVGRVDRQAGELAVPVINQRFQFAVHLIRDVGIAVQQRTRRLFALLRQQERNRLRLAGLERQHRVQRTAGVAIEVEGIAQVAIHNALGVGEAPLTEEAFAAAGIALDRAACQTEEALAAIFAIRIHAAELVDMLDDMVTVEGRCGDKLRILEVDQILLIVALSGQLAVRENGDGAGLVGLVRHRHAPNLVRRAQRHIVQRLALDAAVCAFDLRVARAVTGDGLVLFQRLLHRPPRCRPIIARFVIPQIDIAPWLIELVEGIAQDASRRAGLDEAVSAGVLGHNRAVFRRAEVVCPRHGRTRVGDDVLARSITKVTELHKRNPPYVIHRQGYLRKRFPGQAEILLPFQTLLSVRIVAYFSSSRKERMHTSETFFPKKRGG